MKHFPKLAATAIAALAAMGGACGPVGLVGNDWCFMDLPHPHKAGSPQYAGEISADMDIHCTVDVERISSSLELWRSEPGRDDWKRIGRDKWTDYNVPANHYVNHNLHDLGILCPPKKYDYQSRGNGTVVRQGVTHKWREQRSTVEPINC